MNQWKETLIEAFTLHRIERKGIFILSSIIVLLMLYRWWDFNTPSTEPMPSYIDLAAVEEWRQQRDSIQVASQSYWNLSTTAQSNNSLSHVIPFDPNQASDSIWKEAGLSEKQIASLRKFQQSGGRFQFREDIAKLYCLPAEQAEALIPVMQLPTRANQEDEEGMATSTYPESNGFLPKKYVGKSYHPLELNHSDSSALVSMKGIGGYTAKKIIQYRERLGGFRSPSQLYEIDRLPRENIDSIFRWLSADTLAIQHIYINCVSLERLKKHPYINSSQARALLAYRDQHGHFKKTSDLQKCVLMDEETIKKLGPYLRFDGCLQP